ncbi:hypothetical protein J1614_003852 [Plenodomus biglobosus]|nr:hypothetical protein J1614_003852 [Plenodomus biglobosus]
MSVLFKGPAMRQSRLEDTERVSRRGLISFQIDKTMILGVHYPTSLMVVLVGGTTEPLHNLARRQVLTVPRTPGQVCEYSYWAHVVPEQPINWQGSRQASEI